MPSCVAMWHTLGWSVIATKHKPYIFTITHISVWWWEDRRRPSECEEKQNCKRTMERYLNQMLGTTPYWVTGCMCDASLGSHLVRLGYDSRFMKPILINYLCFHKIIKTCLNGNAAEKTVCFTKKLKGNTLPKLTKMLMMSMTLSKRKEWIGNYADYQS